MNRSDFQELSRIRLAEAEALLQRGHYDGAYYLAGYAIECALKACIARRTQRNEFPLDRKSLEDVYTHNIIRLVRAAGLDAALHGELSADPTFRGNWATCTDWNEESRYERKTRTEAENLYNAIVNRRHGVIRWLRQHW